MLIKIEVVKTYWVGVEADQKEDLLSGVLKAVETDTGLPQLTRTELEALNALRLALLNA